MTNEEKSNEIAQQCDFTTNSKEVDVAFKAAMKMAEWKDGEHKDIEDGLRLTINALDAQLQSANESGMRLFDKYNLQKQQFIDKAIAWLKNNIHDYYMTCEFEEHFDDMFDDFKKAMK